MKRTVALTILNCAAALVTIGGCFDMLLPAVPSNLLGYLEISRTELSPHLSSLVLGLLRALEGCLLAIGITAFLIINGPLEARSPMGVMGAGDLDWRFRGVNASQMWRFGSPYYFPLAFVALTAAGLLLLPRKLPKDN